MYAPKVPRRSNASIRSIVPSQTTERKCTVAIKKIGSSVRNKSRLMTIFPPRSARIPTIRRMFVIFEPTTLAITISGAPLSTPAIEDASSGSEVPNPTISTPMANFDMPNDAPSCFAPTTNPSAPRTRTNSETSNTTVQIEISNIVSILPYLGFQTTALGTEESPAPLKKCVGLGRMARSAYFFSCAGLSDTN